LDRLDTVDRKTSGLINTDKLVEHNNRNNHRVDDRRGYYDKRSCFCDIGC
jgi:hypothetical protein